MATSTRQDDNMESNDQAAIQQAIAQEEAQLTPQEREARQYIKKTDDMLGVLYMKRVREAAFDGFENGFKINIMRPREVEEGTMPPLRRKNILTGEEEWDMDWQPRPFHKQTLTTKDYNDFVQYRYKWLNEKNFGDQSKAEDMEFRLFEFGAMKFLGMNHDDYVHADKEQVRVAVDACTQITAWNGQYLTGKEYQEQTQQQRGKKPEVKIIESENRRSKAPRDDYTVPTKLIAPTNKPDQETPKIKHSYDDEDVYY